MKRVEVSAELRLQGTFSLNERIHWQSFVIARGQALQVAIPSIERLQTCAGEIGHELVFSLEAKRSLRAMSQAEIQIHVIEDRPHYILVLQQTFIPSAWKSVLKPLQLTPRRIGNTLEFETPHVFMLACLIDHLRPLGYQFSAPPSLVPLYDVDEHLLACTTDSGTHNVALYPHQHAGVKWFCSTPALRGLIADEAGCGKTITAAAILSRLIEEGHVRRCLWVVPKNELITQIRDELLQKFELSFYPFTNKSPQQRFGGTSPLYREHALCIVTWSTFIRDWTENLADVLRFPFDMVIFDEVHQAQRGNRTYDAVLNCPAMIRLSLSGTPLPNGKWYEVYNILYCTDPEHTPLEDTLKKRMSAIFKINNPKTSEEEERTYTIANKMLIKTLAAHFSRHTKKDIAKTFPQLREKTLHIQLTENEETVLTWLLEIMSFIIDRWKIAPKGDYQTLKNVFWQDVRGFSSYGPAIFRKRLVDMFQHHTTKPHVQLLFQTHKQKLQMIRQYYQHDLLRPFPKFETCLSYLQTHPEQYVLIFCNSVETAIRLGGTLETQYPQNVRVITGDISNRWQHLPEEERETMSEEMSAILQRINHTTAQKLEDNLDTIHWFWEPYTSLLRLKSLPEMQTIEYRIDEKSYGTKVNSILLVNATTIDICGEFDLTMEETHPIFTTLRDHLAGLPDTEMTLTRESDALRLSLRLTPMFTDTHCRRKRVLISTRKLYQGFNLQIAKTILFYDQPLSISQKEQQIARIQRMGAPYDTINIFSLHCGLDYSITRTLSEKYAQIDHISSS